VTAATDLDTAAARYLVGIDLGTTNSAVAYVDTAETAWVVRDFPVPQLVGPGLVEPRPTLPSFHYEAAAGEFPPGALRLPWAAVPVPSAAPAAVDEPRTAVGVLARDHGAAVPGRLVASAKSWLSHSGVDRTAGLLPWHGAADVEELSPVDVSSRYLAHLRAAWDHAHPDHPLASQDVVLTVPASFDEVARELTVQAAKAAGLAPTGGPGSLTLVEEPQAAFYAWIAAQGANWDQRVRPGQTILVCDVGGGTSDFTLIRVRPAAGGDGKPVGDGEQAADGGPGGPRGADAGGRAAVLFHRVAVGEHLILGGDNLDLALAHHVESRLVAEGRPKLDPRQWAAAVRAARAVKETLLGPSPPDRTSVSIPGGGSKLVGSSVRVDLTRDEVERVLVDGFLPKVALTDKPAARRSGFQEFGLPFAPDPAVTRYLAAFLSAHRDTARGDLVPCDDEGDGRESHDPARPDLVLFNGGLFESPALRNRLLDVLTSWFAGPESWSPTVLANDRLDLAVARGAAYYGTVRRGRGVRIRGGLAHSYYLGVETAGGGVAGDGGATAVPPVAAVCLLPAGVEEGQTVDLPGRRFDLLIRQPAEFPLYYSATRTTDRPGQIVAVDAEQLTALPPIRTVLTSGRSASAATVPVEVHAKLTEIGTLEIWCAEAAGSGGRRTWRLQFDVRGASQANAARHDGQAERQGVVDEQTLVACRSLIRSTFRKGGSPPASLVKALEQATGQTRWEWPASLMRGFWETLAEPDVMAGLRLSLDHEARWLSLAGFSLRPGYGLAVDDWRVAQTWKLAAQDLAFPKNEQVRAEWWVLWRRLAGGLSAGQQATLADPLIADWRTFVRKNGVGVRGRLAAFQFGPHESAEVWRLLGSLELLKPAVKADLAGLLFDRLTKEKVAQVRDAILFAIGRVGARMPVYGPLNATVDAGEADAWVRRLVALDPPGDKASFAAVLLARRTGDRWRDVADATRGDVAAWLERRGAPGHWVALVREGGRLEEEEQRSAFGESLPRGLRIE
jgi:molecular chaperone DnaK (HSP70)